MLFAQESSGGMSSSNQQTYTWNTSILSRSIDSCRNNQGSSIYSPYSQSQHKASRSTMKKGKSVESKLSKMDLGSLPEEIQLVILSYLPLTEKLSFGLLNKHYHNLSFHPSLHRHLSLYTLPSNPLPKSLNRILRSVQHLELLFFPTPIPYNRRYYDLYGDTRNKNAPRDILNCIFNEISNDQLLSFTFPFSASYISSKQIRSLLIEKGGKLENLDLRCGNIGDELDWLIDLGRKYGGLGLKKLDLSDTGIHELPKFNDGFKQLKKLCLAHCIYLSEKTLSSLFEELPESIEYLDLSRLNQTTVKGLMGLKVVRNDQDEDGSMRLIPTRSTCLRDVKLTGIDYLTRSDIRLLRKHWEDQRRDIIDSEEDVEMVVPVPRVWGEPITPPSTSHPVLPSPFQTPPLGLIDVNDRPSFNRNISPISSSASMSISTSSGSSSSSSTPSSSSFNNPITPPSRISVLPEHSKLWESLSREKDELDIIPSPSLEYCKLPNHPLLPFNPDPNRPRFNLTSLHDSLLYHTPSTNSHIQESQQLQEFKEQEGGMMLLPSPEIIPSAQYNRLPVVKGRQLTYGANPREHGKEQKNEKGWDGISIAIHHSALLESEDEAGYRQFINEVSGSVVSISSYSYRPTHYSGIGLGSGGLGLI